MQLRGWVNFSFVLALPPLNNDICETLLNELKSVDENILKLSGNKLINLLLYGDSKFDSNKNTRLLNAAIKYIIDSGRFTVPLV